MPSSFERLIADLARLKRTKFGFGLDGPRRWAALLGNPHLAYPTVHVAGTNGKGSVVGKVAKALELSGYRVGMYVSPHITSFCERISINGQRISEDEVAQKVLSMRAQAIHEAIPPFFFDLITLLAFCYFQEQKIDVAVIETGLGGRHDPTNLVKPLLSVITSISRDHCECLGQSLEEIAYDKAGIIKFATPVVVGPRARFAAIRSTACKLQAPLYEVNDCQGFYENENQAIAKEALARLKSRFSIDLQSEERGLQHRPFCRFEQLSLKRNGAAIDLLLDAAHNPDGIARLLEAIETHYPNRELLFLAAFSKNKEIDLMLEKMVTKGVFFYFVATGNTKIASPITASSYLQKSGYAFFRCGDSVEEALSHAIERVRVEKKSFLIVCCGTFAIMDQARKALQKFAPFPLA